MERIGLLLGATKMRKRVVAYMLACVIGGLIVLVVVRVSGQTPDVKAVVPVVY